MRIKKKRGIIPDGLVQMRLETFKKSFPNLKTKFDITGESSTNERGAAHQRDIVLSNGNGGSGSKRKRQENSDSGGKRKRNYL